MFGDFEINIKGNTGEIIPFVGGKSFITLHFHQKMIHQDYCCNDSTCQAYEQYYISQAQNRLPGFQGMTYQRGHSLENLFLGLIGVAAPY